MVRAGTPQEACHLPQSARITRYGSLLPFPYRIKECANTQKVISGRVTKSGGTRKAKASAPKYQEDDDDMQMDSESDNSTYQLSGGEEPAGLRMAKKFRAQGASNGGRNGSASNGDQYASEDGQGGQDDGHGDVYYDAPEREKEDFQQC